MDAAKYAYIDEFGDTNLETVHENVSTHYVITAIVADADNVGRIKEEIEKTRSAEFQSGEMKSSKIGNDQRRIRILRKLSGHDYRIYTLVVDKRQLRSKGYQYQDVFFKNLNAKLYWILWRDFAVLRIFADEYKTTKFMKESKLYADRKFPSPSFLLTCTSIR